MLISGQGRGITIHNLAVTEDNWIIIGPFGHIFSADYSHICGLKKVIGSCKAFYPRWYFDSETGMCKEFSYSGCGGNDNNFGSEQICQSICGGRLEFFK